MKLDGSKIIEATENELFDLWLKSGYCDIMSFNIYLLKMKNAGVIIVE